MFWNNSSYINNERGKSVGGKMASMASRYIEPKFMSKIGQSRIDLPKQKTQNRRQVVKKENVPPEETKAYSKMTITGDKFNKSIFSKTQDQVFQITAKIETDNIKYSNVRGLHNIGNTCYMNSTLQCLFHLPVFNTYFCQEFKKKQKGSMSIQYYNLLETLYNSSSSSAINPVDFKRSVGRKKPRFLGNSQQDAQQFLTTFLQLMNEQLTRINQKPKYQELENDPTKKSIKQLSNEWWDYYLKRDNSIICDIFQGQIISTVKCKKCDHKSVTFDNLWGIPVSLSRGKSVSELLTEKWQSQCLIDDYNCAKCKKTRICSRTLDLFRLPEVLIVQLKRFQYGKFIKRKKNDEIKIQKQLNVNLLLSSHSPLKSSDQKYRLSGIIHHFGDTDYGHYTADIYSSKKRKWFDMDDSRFDQKQIEGYSNSAYVLFYQKCR